jgi:hypothetical protein
MSTSSVGSSNMVGMDRILQGAPQGPCVHIWQLVLQGTRLSRLCPNTKSWSHAVQMPVWVSVCLLQHGGQWERPTVCCMAPRPGPEVAGNWGRCGGAAPPRPPPLPGGDRGPAASGLVAPAAGSSLARMRP